MKKTKTKLVLAIADSKAGGAQKYVLDIAMYLKKKNLDVEVWCPRGPLFGKLSKNNLNVLQVNFNLRNIFKLRKLLKKNSSLVINTNLLGTTFYIWLASLFSIDKIKIVSTLHNPIIYKTLNWKKRFLFPLVLKLISNKIDIFIGVSKYMCSQITHYTNCKCECVSTAVILSEFPIINNYREKENYNVGIIGRLSSEKGHIYFIRAAEIICQKRDDVIFYIVGDGELREELERMVCDLGLSSKVVFTGFMDDVNTVRLDMDVVVVPSLFEGGNSYTLLEAMAMGIPVVASSVGGILDVLTNEKYGLLVAPQDSSAIAEAVLKLIDDRIMAQNIAINAREKVEEAYNFSRNAEKYVNILIGGEQKI
ncbi:MAG: glycosyltransferase family 4 protein [Veillonellales bacterium]